MYFVMLEFVNEKKKGVEVDKKKVFIATKKINYEAFLVLQKVVPMDYDAYEEQHKTFTLRLNSGRNKMKVPDIESVVKPWAAAIQAYVLPLQNAIQTAIRSSQSAFPPLDALILF